MNVQLYVYDLSQGLARQMSRQFLGVHIDAVYHTSLVFGGVEYFFGQGVQTSYPGSTHHGRPMETIPLGETALPIEVILEYLESLKEVYTAASYDLFTHNCNNFTNDFAMFLVGSGIPDHITSLPKTVLDTPFGQMLRPQLDRAMRPVTQAPVQPPLTALNTSSQRNGTTSTNGLSSHLPARKQGEVHNVTTESRLNQLLEQAKKSCAVIFFTSQTCGPCKMLYPIYDELAAELGTKAVLVKVDVGNAREIGIKYSVSATPTFHTFLKGKHEETWSGADASKLRGNVRLLVQTVFPPHPHQLLKLPKFSRQATRPITYAKVPPLEKLQAKMGPSASDPTVRKIVDFIKSRNSETKAQSTPIPDLPAISSFLINSLSTMPVETLFTVYDLLRLLLSDPRISGYFAQEASLKTTLALLTHVNTLQSSETACPYNLRLCAVHAACNLFTSPLFKTSLRSRNDSNTASASTESLVSVLVTLIASALLDESHPALRVSASSLTYNLATAEHTERQAAAQDVVDDGAEMLLSDAQQVELAASLLEALSASTQASGPDADAKVEATRLQALALARLAYLAPVDGEVMDLCRVLDAKGVVLRRADEAKLSGDAKAQSPANGAVKTNGAQAGTAADDTRTLLREIGSELFK